MKNNPLKDQRFLRQTLEYDQAVYLLKLKEITAEKMKTINKELKNINYLSHDAVTLARADVQSEALMDSGSAEDTDDLDHTAFVENDVIREWIRNAPPKDGSSDLVKTELINNLTRS